MIDLDDLTRQVRYNCDVSDAQHAGIYSVCGLAMRLRDLYKWERRLAPWQEHESGRVLDWIGQREALWESLTEAEYRPLRLNDLVFDHFDSAAINTVLAPRGLFYGAGYAHSLKPTFFLARVDSRQAIDGRTVWRLGQELARDLLTLPAFTQDDQVVLRREAARMYLWDQLAYLPNSARPALAFALTACCRLAETDLEHIRPHLARISQIQEMTYIRHEMSELDEGVFERGIWRRMLADFPHTAVELLIRTLKDVLADTAPRGPLHHFIQARSDANLGFYMAFSGGLVPLLFGDLKSAFEAFMQHGRWPVIEAAVVAVQEKAALYAREVMAIYADGCQKPDLPWAQAAIEATLQARGVPIRHDAT